MGVSMSLREGDSRGQRLGGGKEDGGTRAYELGASMVRVVGSARLPSWKSFTCAATAELVVSRERDLDMRYVPEILALEVRMTASSACRY